MLLHSPKVQAQRPAEDDWNFSLGAALAAGPNYEGSSHHVVAPLPFLQLKWKDRVRLDFRGLNFVAVKTECFRLGVGAALDFGRNEDGGSFIVESEDDSLEGMGDISPALGPSINLSYDFEPVTAVFAVTKFVGGDNDGLLASAGLQKRFFLSRSFALIPAASLTWADSSYTQTFFGVSQEQSVRSRFPVYQAGSGFKDLEAGTVLLYSLNNNWQLFTRVAVSQLLEDAEESPISSVDLGVSAFSALTYSF